MANPQHTKLANPIPFGEVDFKTYDYLIGGKMVVGRASMDDSYAQMIMSDQDARENIKKKLISDMAQYILENNLVEFTQQDDPMTLCKNIYIRAYLAPNDQVKILRLANKII
jgi:hypothetical protein